jgi:protein SHQ1
VESLTETLQDLTFDDKEREALLSLPNKEHLISDHRPILLSLVDIIFGYCYDCRMTEGDSNVESPWTISILSPTLSWFEAWDGKEDPPKAVMTAAVRRSLIYPYCRFLGLSTTLLKDVLRIMGRGRRAVLKALLASRAVMEKSDTHYMLNKFYLDDYVIWVQKIEEGLLGEFVTEVERGLGELEKDEWRELKEAIDLDVPELEKMVVEQSGL